MGLFSSKTKVYVASTVYNLAGDPDLRPNVLKSIVLGGVLGGTKKGLGEHIQESLASGPATRQRKFFAWAKDNYKFGMPSASMNINQPVDAATAQSGLLPLLSLAPNQTIRVFSAIIDDPDIHYWAERWIMEHHPSVGEEGWAAEWDEVAQEIIVFVGDLEEVRLPAPADLIWAAQLEGRKLLYLAYEVITQNQNTLQVVVSEPRLFTYRMGTGNVVFDALLRPEEPMAEFFPVIPLRKNKKSIRHETNSKYLPNVEKAYKRLTGGGDIHELLDQIKENVDIGDVDSVYIAQGVSLNTAENAGKEYVYKFLRKLMERQFAREAEIVVPPPIPPREELANTWGVNRWIKTHKEAETSAPKYQAVRMGFLSSLIFSLTSNGTLYELRVRSPDLTRADFRIGWRRIEETVHVGNAKTYDGRTDRRRAKVGEYWFKVADPYKLRTPYKDNEGGSSIKVRVQNLDQVYLFHQFAPRRYTKLTCVALVHRNLIYDKHSDDTLASDALRDDEESSFLVPLHMPTLREIGMVKSSQLVTCTNYLVFNSYKKVKQRWYQRGIFKVVFAIAAIAISFFTAGGSLAAMGGILGTNLSVGLALGASVASAAIVGAITNAIAAMIVTTMISKASVKLFGEKFGSIIGAIASFVAITYGTQFATHGNFAVNWGQILRVENLMKLTNSVNDAYSRWLAADTADIYAQMGELEEQYGDKLEELRELSKETLGMTSGEIDPMLFTDASEYFGESSDSFLSRTMLTGSDIAELTFAMVENFADISLELPGSSFQTA